MADKVKEVIVLKQQETFWYEATVMRNRNGMAVTRTQQGTLQATSPLDALDKLDERAKTAWRGQIVRAKVCEMDENGVIVSTTNSIPPDKPDLNLIPYEDEIDSKDIWEWTTRWTPPIFRTYRG